MPPAALRSLIFVAYAAVSYAIFFLVPFDTSVIWLALWFALGLGFAGQLVFDWHRTRAFWSVVGRTTLALLFVACLLAVLWVETVICIAIILPIAILIALIGVALIRVLLDRFEATRRLCLTFLALPLVIPLVDLPTPMVSETVSVATVITIDAPAKAVRAFAENVSDIAESERPWTLTHKILRAPRPVAAHTSGGIRHAQWTKGVRFEEHLLPGPDLAWRFAFPEPERMQAVDPRISPTGPEVVMLEGRYAFTPLGHNRTRVTLTTTYQLTTPINAYLKLWGRLFLADMHNAVLHVIASRAEAVS